MSEQNKEMTENKADKTKADEALTGEVESRKEPTTEKSTSPASSTEVAKRPALTKDELATLDYTDFSTPARMLKLGEVLAKSQLVPLKKPEDVVVALMTGKELGLPFVTSVSQIYPINGRPTLGVHIQKAILLKNKVLFRKTEDAVEIYQFVKADENGTVILVTKGDKKVPVPIGEGTAEEQPKNSAKRKIDHRTTYEFTREIKMPSGKFKEQTAKGTFSLREATEAELVDKDVWKKYWRRMLDARAFTIGAREIADDLLLGMMTAEEVGADFIEDTDYEEVK